MCGFVLVVSVALPAFFHAEIASGQEEAADRERPGSLLRVNPGGEIRFGALEIHPGLEYRFIYDDNIFKDRSGKVDDLINQVTPSIGFKLPLGGRRHEINLYSEARFWAFEDRDNENHQDYFGRGNALFRLGDRFELTGSGSFEKTEDPSTSELQSTTGARTPRTNLIGSGGVVWKVSPKTRLSIGGRFTQDRYKQPSNDRLEKDGIGGSVEAFYLLLPKTSIVFSYRFNATDFVNRPATDSNDDSSTHTVLGGVEFDPTAKLSGRISVGATMREFEAIGRRNETAISVATDLTWRPLARSTLGFQFRREFADASQSGETVITRTTANGSVQQALTRKFGIDASFNAVLDEFLNSPTQRVDITYTAATGVEYRLSRWLNFGVAYEFEKKDSDADVNDYTQSQGIFKIQANL